jgi:hypothetical protein
VQPRETDQAIQEVKLRCSLVKLRDAQESKALCEFFFLRKDVYQYLNTPAKLQSLLDTGKIFFHFYYLDSATFPTDILSYIAMKFEYLITVAKQHHLWVW